MRLSLRVRLTVAFAMGMTLVLIGFGTFVYFRVGRDLLASVDLGLRARAQAMAGAILERGSGVIDASGELIDPDESFAQVLDVRGQVLQASSEASGVPFLSLRTIESVTEPTFFVRTLAQIDSDPLRLLAAPVTSSGHRVFVVAGVTLGDRRDALKGLLVSLAIGGPVALFLLSWAGWMIVGAALRPVERMRQEAEAISASELDRRLPLPSSGDELARLGATLNAMLDRLQQALERERRFVDDASHELRTPLSILKMELDLALARSRTVHELEGTLRNASAETDRLAGLARDLLVLARMERGRVPVHRAVVSIQDLVGESITSYAGRAREAGVRIDVDVQPGTVSVDPVRLRQALENLLDNAVRQTRRGGAIRVRAGRVTDTEVRIAVEDQGAGFPEELTITAFEPFVRSDTDIGNGSGAGLGLTIVRAVAEAHQGRATAENLPERGARVTMLIRG